MTDDEFKTEFSMYAQMNSSHAIDHNVMLLSTYRWAIAASPLVFTAPIMNCTKSADGTVACKGWLSDLQKEILLNTEVRSWASEPIVV